MEILVTQKKPVFKGQKVSHDGKIWEVQNCLNGAIFHDSEGFFITLKYLYDAERY